MIQNYEKIYTYTQNFHFIEAKCPKKERFEKCPAALCLPQTCDDLGIEIPCLPTDGGFCPGGPGCICDDGLVRNEDGKCIPKRQCRKYYLRCQL